MVRRIYFYPSKLAANAYSQLQIAVLANIAPVLPVNAKTLVRGLFQRRGAVAIINFLEDRTAYHKNKPNSAFVTSVLFLIAIRLVSEKLIWVRHNHWPHDLPRDYQRQNVLLDLMNCICDVVVTHREVAGVSSLVAPHPLYFEGQLPESVRDIDFLYFGAIKRYKRLDTLLRIWPRDRRLVVAGSVPDRALFAELQNIVETRRLDVEFVARFLSEDELTALLQRTRFAVQSHGEEAMIVSGAFFHAAALGANIVAMRNEFSASMASQFDFVTVFDEDTIEDVVSNVKYVAPDVVVANLRAKNGTKQCVDAWSRIFEAP